MEDPIFIRSFYVLCKLGKDTGVGVPRSFVKSFLGRTTSRCRAFYQAEDLFLKAVIPEIGERA